MRKKNLIIIALLTLILGNFFSTLVDVIVKLLAADVGIYQYLFFRQIAVLLILLPFWLNLPAKRRKLDDARVHAFRASMTTIGAPSAVIALIYLPLATANVIFYAAPMITLLLAAVIFREKVGRQRTMITLLGFIGVAIALRPEYLGSASLFAFCTAGAIAAYNISVKWLPLNSSVVSTIFWSNLFVLPLFGIIAAFNWQPVTLDLIYLATGSCLCLVAYQGCCILAFQKADASAIAVAEYSGLVFAAGLGWLIFHESVDLWTIAGISLIILPVIWHSWFEHRQELSLRQQELLLQESAAHPEISALKTGKLD